MSRLAVRAACAAAAIAAVAACTPQRMARQDEPAARPAPAPARHEPCKPAQAGSPMVGTWYASSSQAGIKGRLHTLMVLGQDGTMRLTNRVSSGRDIRSELREAGCWEAEGGMLATRVTQSNGEDVDPQEEIYRNRFRVERVNARELVYREARGDAPRVTAKRMPPGYRLP